MGAGGQYHAATALPPDKKTRHPSYRKLFGPKVSVWRGARQRKYLFRTGVGTPNHPASSKLLHRLRHPAALPPGPRSPSQLLRLCNEIWIAKNWPRHVNIQDRNLVIIELVLTYSVPRWNCDTGWTTGGTSCLCSLQRQYLQHVLPGLLSGGYR